LKTVWSIEIPPHVAEVVRRLPPDVKLAVKASLRTLSLDPHVGEPLLGELEGLRKYRVRRYRIVYAVNRKARVLQVFAIGHRRGVYEEALRARRRG
jgi:mRNA interferase RelE/StbE